MAKNYSLVILGFLLVFGLVITQDARGMLKIKEIPHTP